MVEMGCLDTMESLDAMVGMEPQEDRERRVTLVYRDHLDYEVCNFKGVGRSPGVERPYIEAAQRPNFSSANF